MHFNAVYINYTFLCLKFRYFFLLNLEETFSIIETIHTLCLSRNFSFTITDLNIIFILSLCSSKLRFTTLPTVQRRTLIIEFSCEYMGFGGFLRGFWTITGVGFWQTREKYHSSSTSL